MKKWLLITNQKRLKDTILAEFKRHPDVFDVVPEITDMSQTEDYNRVIIGDDMWKHYYYKGKHSRLYYDMLGRSLREGLLLNVVSQCNKCKKKGIRLNISRCMYDGICKECRQKETLNPNTIIQKEDADWIKKTLKFEPKKVDVINKKIPDELAKITQDVIDKYFPEFKGINLRYTTTAHGRSLYEWNIALNPDILKWGERSYMHTIAHELTHQMVRLQGVLRGRSDKVAHLYNQQIPSGELQCEMWTFARHPDLIASSYFFKKRDNHLELKEKHGGFTEGYRREVHKLDQEHFVRHIDTIHELSKQALIKRKEGEVRYLHWYREEMKKIEIEGCGR